MALIGVWVGLFVLGVASPAAAALPNPCVEEEIGGQMVPVCPYEGVGAFGSNNIGDFDFSRCNLTDGCVDVDGDPCPANTQCVLKAIPPGWCSEGTNTACVWPNPVGRCSSSLFACVETADCPSGETCTGTIDTSCQCTNDSNPVTGLDTVCGGLQARCSDGDNPIGAFGTGLCIDLVLGEDSDYSNCGEESGLPLSGPRWQVENPGAPQTPQREPGSGYLFGKGGIVDTKDRFAVAIQDPDEFGVRRMAVLGDSFHSDWAYSDKAVTEGIVNSHIITHSFDSKVGWSLDLPVDGRCTGNPGKVCIQDSDCGTSDTCDPETFVYGHERAINAPFFLWTETVDPNDPSIPRTLDKDGDGDLDPDCPPLCGLNYFLNSFEEEMIRQVGGAARDLTDPLLKPIPGDPDAGVQLSFNVLEPKDDLDPDDQNGWAGAGDVVGVNQIVSLTWLPASDMRCFVGGNPDRMGFCAEEKRCEGGARDGELCDTISDCGGKCVGGTNANAPCVDNGDCEGGECLDPTTRAFCIGGLDAGAPCDLDKDCRLGGTCARCLSVDCETADDCATGDCLDKKIGRCSASADPCNPFTELNQFNKTGTTDDCRAAGIDDQDTFTCQFCGGPYIDPDAPLNTCLPFPDRRCVLTGTFCRDDDECPQFTTGRSDIIAAGGNLQAGPIGYNDHGIGALDITGRISGINGVTVGVRVPLFIVGTTGSVALEFRDNDGAPTSPDRRGLGPIQSGTGARGLGLGGTFENDPGLILPAGGTCCDTGADIVYGPDNPGTPEGPLALAVSWGSGANKIPGCILDNNPAQEPTCQFPLGIDDPNVLGLIIADPNACFDIQQNGEPVPGCNTGLDDGKVTAVIGGVEVPAVVPRRDIYNPDAPAPTVYYVAAGSARDLDVAGSRRNADALFKVEGLWCPVVEVEDGVYEPVCCTDPTGSDESCFGGALPDQDGDGVLDVDDNCVTVKNANQTNSDTDPLGDACDNCRNISNAGCPAGRGCTGGQLDDDQDGYGNVCDPDFDASKFINVSDLLRFLDSFGKNISTSTCQNDAGAPTGTCARYDLDATGPIINVPDLLVMIGPLFGTPVQGCAQDDGGVVQCPLP